MQASLIKVVAAFVAGLVVALGSALIYVRVTEMMHPPAAVEITSAPRPALEELPDTGSPTRVETPAPSVAPVQKPVSKQDAPRTTAVRRHKPAEKAHRPAPKTVEVAQNTAAPVPVPPPPAVDPAPQPPTGAAIDAVLENQAPQATAPVRQPHVVTLESGTNLVIRLGEALSTDRNYTGDTFRATLESPIIREGFIIAERGSKVLGRVVNARKAGRMEGVSDLTLALTEINTTDGQHVRIESSTYEKRGSVSAGEDAAKIAGGAALGAILGAIAGGGRGAAIGAGAGGAAGTGAVFVTRGKPASLPIEARLTFRLATPVTITERLNN